MPRNKMVNGVVLPMGPSEESAKTAEELQWEATERPVQTRREAYKQAVQSLMESMDYEDLVDLLVLGHGSIEVQLYKLNNAVDTPVIDGFATVFPGRTKAQIATIIESRFQGFLGGASIALAEKIKSELL